MKILLMLTALFFPSGDGGCQFPVDWVGSWHHLGYDDPLNVTTTSIDMKGTCFQNVNENNNINKTGYGQFILREEKGCLKCMIIYQKHFNVLQYRESDCDSKQGILSRGAGLSSLCTEIPGDAAMYSMIRVWSRPVECPLQGPYSLAYGKGGADKQCSHPPSLMDSCNDDSVIQIKYQACPDIQGSESKVERMTCVAKWKEGNKRYFVALVTSRQSKWVEQKDRYQCFLYEDISNKMKMAQGQFTSTCQGLWSVLEGSRTFSLQKLARPESCTLPSFLIQNRRWKSMNHNLSIHLDDGNTSFSFMKSGTMLEQVSCHSSELDTSLKKARLIAHVKSGCSSGYICFNLTQLNENLIEATYGLRSNHPREACEHYYFSAHTWTVSTMVAENRSSPCPFSGSYRVDGQVNHLVDLFKTNALPKLVYEEIEDREDQEEDPEETCSTYMQAGCSNSHTLEIKTECDDQPQNRKQSLLCHGMWTTSPGSNRLIVSDPGDLFYCLDYKEKDGVVEGNFMRGVCDYSPLINISSTGPCILPLTAGDISPAHTLSVSVALATAIVCVTAVNLRR
jgi:hypothetical protein